MVLFFEQIIWVNAKEINYKLPSLVNSSEYCNFNCSILDLIEETVALNSCMEHKLSKNVDGHAG